MNEKEVLQQAKSRHHINIKNPTEKDLLALVRYALAVGFNEGYLVGCNPQEN